MDGVSTAWGCQCPLPLSIDLSTFMKNHYRWWLTKSRQRLCCRQKQSVYWIAAVYCRRLSFLDSPPETHAVGFRTVGWRVSRAYVIQYYWCFYWPGQSVDLLLAGDYCCEYVLCERPALTIIQPATNQSTNPRSTTNR